MTPTNSNNTTSLLRSFAKLSWQTAFRRCIKIASILGTAAASQATTIPTVLSDTRRGTYQARQPDSTPLQAPHNYLAPFEMRRSGSVILWRSQGTTGGASLDGYDSHDYEFVGEIDIGLTSFGLIYGFLLSWFWSWALKLLQHSFSCAQLYSVCLPCKHCYEWMFQVPSVPEIPHTCQLVRNPIHCEYALCSMG